MAGRKELFLNNGRLVEDGSCGSPFCKSGCHDSGAGRGVTDPVTVWQEAYSNNPPDAAGEIAKKALQAAVVNLVSGGTEEL